MKRTSLLGLLAMVIVSFTGCVIHSAHIDPYTGCRTGCSIEAVPDGPLDGCFYVKILQCPLFPWNWGQFLHGCDICDVPPCGGCGWDHGCGPAYPPMLTGGCCDTGCAPSCGAGCGVGGFGGHDFGGYPAPLTSSAMGGGCCDAPHASHGMMPSHGPMPGHHGPMHGHHGPMPGYGPMPPGGPHGGSMHAPAYGGDPVPQRMPGGMGRPPQGPMGPPMGPMMPMGQPMGPMNPPMGPMNPPMQNAPPGMVPAGMAPAALMQPTTTYMPTTTYGPSYFQRATGPRVASPYATTHQVDGGTITPVSASASLPVVAPH